VDDAELLERTRRGDEAAFSQLFERYQRAIYRYAVYMCGRDAGDDIVQETFMAVLQQTARRDRPRGAVIAYLMGIARHRVLKRMASQSEAALTEALDEQVAAATFPDRLTVLDDLTRAEAIQSVRAAVESLPPVYREVVVLCELEEMDYVAAAEVMESPIGTVRSRLHRARNLLTARLASSRPAVSAREGR
jgi:RNA polymerase sigma-70 factor (ECF subfamily)